MVSFPRCSICCANCASNFSLWRFLCSIQPMLGKDRTEKPLTTTIHFPSLFARRGVGCNTHKTRVKQTVIPKPTPKQKAKTPARRQQEEGRKQIGHPCFCFIRCCRGCLGTTTISFFTLHLCVSVRLELSRVREFPAKVSRVRVATKASTQRQKKRSSPSVIRTRATGWHDLENYPLPTLLLNFPTPLSTQTK